MTQGVDRRAFIAGLAEGAAVMAFDPVRHSWMTAAQAAPHGGLRIPRLDGELVIEPGALEEAPASTSGTSYIARRPLCCDRVPHRTL